MTNFFWYRAIVDLTFGDLYGHFYAENWSFLSLTPWGINLLAKTWYQNKFLAGWNNFVYIWSQSEIWFQSYDHFY